MKPYAYKDQDLMSHLEGTANKALTFLSTAMNEETIIKRFKQSDLEIDKSQLRQVVRLSALLHDIGKAADHYQDNPNVNKFPLHELPSAVIAERVLRNYGILSEKHKALIVLTVLQHMSTMRDWISDIMPNIRIKKWKFTKYHKEINDFLAKSGIGRCEYLDVTAEDAHKLVKDYQNLLSGHHYKWHKLYLLILAPVTAADNLDAFEFRKDNLTSERRWFVEELKSLETA